MKENILAMLKTLIFMWVLTAIFLFVMSAVVYKMHGDNTGITVCVYFTYGLVNFAGGFIFGKVMGKKKYLFGLMTGVLYFMTIVIISAGVYGGVALLEEKALFTLLCCSLSGMLGGMLSN